MVTLAEVGKHAGVSASTVSYVLSGKRSISRSTRERVELSIKPLGHHPNAGARALASSKSNIIALMMPLRTDMYVPVMMEIALAVTTTARAHGQDVLLLTGEEGLAAVRRVAGSGMADAKAVEHVITKLAGRVEDVVELIVPELTVRPARVPPRSDSDGRATVPGHGHRPRSRTRGAGRHTPRLGRIGLRPGCTGGAPRADLPVGEGCEGVAGVRAQHAGLLEPGRGRFCVSCH